MVGLPWIQTIGASTGMMVAMASPNAAPEPFNWARVVKHEYVHILTLQSTRFNIPHWFTEALAVTEEGYPRPAIWNRLLALRVPQGDIPILDELNRGFTKPETPDDWQYAYCQSRLHAQYIAETFGPSAIAKMLAGYREGLSTDQVVSRALGVDRAAFSAGYRKFVEQLVGGLQSAAGRDPRSFDELKEQYEKDKADLKTAAAYAMALLRRRERRAARDVAEAVIERDKTVPLAAAVLADLELAAEDDKAAEKYLSAALDVKSPHPALVRRLARIRLGRSDFKGAAAMYELGRRIAIDKTEWLRGLAVCYLKLEEREKLIDVLKELTTIEADDGAVSSKLAELYSDKKDYANALHYGRLALQVDVMNPETHRLLARAYAATDKPEQAVREYEVVQELVPGDAEATSKLDALRKP
jgi:tetratricopeptide (TPR) repeat protein